MRLQSKKGTGELHTVQLQLMTAGIILDFTLLILLKAKLQSLSLCAVVRCLKEADGSKSAFFCHKLGKVFVFKQKTQYIKSRIKENSKKKKYFAFVSCLSQRLPTSKCIEKFLFGKLSLPFIKHTWYSISCYIQLPCFEVVALIKHILLLQKLMQISWLKNLCKYEKKVYLL